MAGEAVLNAAGVDTPHAPAQLGALILPLDRVDARAPALLPDKTAEIVVYCASGPCKNSGIAAARLDRGRPADRNRRRARGRSIPTFLGYESGFSARPGARDSLPGEG